MQIIPATDPEAPRQAAEILRAGGVILYPTDTLYGIGADALSDAAVDTIYAIKGRDDKKPIHAIVADIETAARYGEIDERVRALAERLPKGKVTFIVKKQPGLDTGILRGIETFGFRIPDHAFCLAMAGAFDGPITATSANASGMAPATSLGGILSQLGPAAMGIGLSVNGGESPLSQPSTVIDLSQGDIRVLREGAVPAATVLDTWSAIV